VSPGLCALVVSMLGAALALSLAFAAAAVSELRAERARASRLLTLVNELKRKDQARRRELLS
jgi:hypothetical protein